MSTHKYWELAEPSDGQDRPPADCAEAEECPPALAAPTPVSFERRRELMHLAENLAASVRLGVGDHELFIFRYFLDGLLSHS